MNELPNLLVLNRVLNVLEERDIECLRQVDNRFSGLVKKNSKKLVTGLLENKYNSNVCECGGNISILKKKLVYL